MGPAMFKIVFWYWWALAAVLLVFEMMLPGVVFLFLAVGAAVAGLLLLIASGPVARDCSSRCSRSFAVLSAVGLRPYLRGLQNTDRRSQRSTRAARRWSARCSSSTSRSWAAAAALSSVTEAGSSPGPTWSRAPRYGSRPSAAPSSGSSRRLEPVLAGRNVDGRRRRIGHDHGGRGQQSEPAARPRCVRCGRCRPRSAAPTAIRARMAFVMVVFSFRLGLTDFNEAGPARLRAEGARGGNGCA